jgi:hypothetical protein
MAHGWHLEVRIRSSGASSCGIAAAAASSWRGDRLKTAPQQPLIDVHSPGDLQAAAGDGFVVVTNADDLTWDGNVSNLKLWSNVMVVQSHRSKRFWQRCKVRWKKRDRKATHIIQLCDENWELVQGKRTCGGGRLERAPAPPVHDGDYLFPGYTAAPGATEGAWELVRERGGAAAPHSDGSGGAREVVCTGTDGSGDG